MTDVKRPPLTADEMTGLRVAGFHVVPEDRLHEEAHRLAVETARADKAESRVRMAGEAFGGILALVSDDIAAATSGATADDLLLRLGTLREQLVDEVNYFSHHAIADETDYETLPAKVEQ